MRSPLGLLALALCIVTAPCRGQTLVNAPAPGASGDIACPSAAQLAAVVVTAVNASDSRFGHDKGRGESALPTVSLRHDISVDVLGLPTLLARAQCGTEQKKIILFLDGRPLVDLNPYPPTNPVQGQLQFVLNRNEVSREVWTHLLGQPSFAARRVKVSVGIEDSYAIASNQFIALEVIPGVRFAVWAALLLFLAALFFGLAIKSDVLRDIGPAPSKGRKPYSLARMQAAFWFFLILAAYLFIGLITGDYASTITSSVLGLMGISAGTIIGSAVIDKGTALAPLAGQAIAPVAVSRSWWLDILSDEHGVNFHRFQMAVWTLVLGIVFIQQVYKSLAMPDFDATLLGLLGISAGTYLGLKTTSE